MTYSPSTPLSDRLDTIADVFRELVGKPCWACWGHKDEPKAPRIAKGGSANGRFALINDPTTWCTFSEARTAVEAGHMKGVGLMLTRLSGSAVLDFDDVRDPDNDTIHTWAEDIVNWAAPITYTEFSFSGCGYHVFTDVDPNAEKKQGVAYASSFGGKTGKIEYWQNLTRDSGRFIALTGDIIVGSVRKLGRMDGAIDYIDGKANEANRERHTGDVSNDLNDQYNQNEIAEILSFISPDAPYLEWLRVLHGLHDHFHGSVEGLKIADEWSQTGAKYKSGEVAKKWKGFTVGGGVKWNSVCALAREYGANLKEISLRSREAKYTETYNIEHGREQALRILSSANSVPEKGQILTQGIPVVHISELEIREPRYLVDGWIEENTFGVVFGEPGACKSFFAQDVAACIATGSDFHGHECRQGRVVYVVGEGLAGIPRRFEAWARHRNVPLDKEVPLQIIPVSIPMLDAKTVGEAINAISNSEICQDDLKLIIIDTLARNFGDGDENSTKDMSIFIAAIHRMMAQFNCTVLVVHHSGHGEKTRARGSSTLRASADTECLIGGKNGTVELHHTKSKDGPKHDKITFCLEQVELGRRADGEAFGSAVLVESNSLTTFAKKHTPAQERALKAYYDAALQKGQFGEDGGFIGVHLHDWRAVFMRISLQDNDAAKRKAFSRAKNDLVQIGDLCVANDVYSYDGDFKFVRDGAIVAIRNAQKEPSNGDGQSNPEMLEACVTNVTCHENKPSRHIGEAGDFVTDSPQPLKGWGVSHPDGGNQDEC